MMGLNIPDEALIQWSFSRGRRITVSKDVVDSKNRVRAKKGKRGVVISQEPHNDTVSIQLDDKHYPCHDVPLDNLIAHLDF